MAKKTAAGSGGSGTLEAPDYGNLLERNGENLKAVIRANEAVLDGMAALSRELMDFGSARLRHDMEASESLLQCRDPEQAFRMQCEFARAATEQYFQEANKLMSIAAKVARDCWTPLEDRTRAALREANGK